MAAQTQDARPVTAYLAILILGFLPLIGVGLFYDDLPNRLVVQWDGLGQVTVIGTRASSVLTIAIAAAAIGVIAVLIAALFNTPLSASRMRGLFLGLNAAQIVTIGLACVALVSEALGYGVTARAAIPPSAAALLFACGLMFWRVSRSIRPGNAPVAALFALGSLLFFAAAAGIFGIGLYFSGTPVGIGGACLALIAMVLLLTSDRNG